MLKTSQKGFTLVEVLVALLIFSIAILGLMRAGTENIRAVNIIEQKQIAGIIADNQLLLILAKNAPLKIGTQQDFVKMAGRQWNWKARIEATERSGFYKLTLTVAQDNSNQIVITRIAFANAQVGARL